MSMIVVFDAMMDLHGKVPGIGSKGGVQFFSHKSPCWSLSRSP